MTCRRCEGLMVEDHLPNLESLAGELWIPAWRCLNCGEILEPTISLNRLVGAGSTGSSRGSSLESRLPLQTSGKRR